MSLLVRCALIFTLIPSLAPLCYGKDEPRRNINLSPHATLSWPRSTPLLVTPLGHNGTLRLDGYHHGKPVSVWVLRQNPTTMARKSVVEKEWELIKSMGQGTLTKASCQEISAISFSCAKESRLNGKNEIHRTLWMGYTDIITMKFSGTQDFKELNDFVQNIRIDIPSARSPAAAPAPSLGNKTRRRP